MQTRYYYTACELATDLGVSPSVLYRAIDAKLLAPYGRTRRQILFRKEDALSVAQRIGRFLSGDKFFRTLLVAEKLATADPTDLDAHELSVAAAATARDAEHLSEIHELQAGTVNDCSEDAAPAPLAGEVEADGVGA